MSFFGSRIAQHVVASAGALAFSFVLIGATIGPALPIA